MPEARVLFFRDGAKVPVLDWMSALREQDRKAFANGVARIRLLKQEGYELDRPASGFLGDGLHELRWKQGHAQYRIIYFFHGRNVVILTWAFQKEGAQVPESEIKRASQYRAKFIGNPQQHAYQQELDPNA
jgi:phage-related protein